MNFGRPFLTVVSVLLCTCFVMYLFGAFVRVTPLAYDVQTYTPPLTVYHVLFFTLALGILCGTAIAEHFRGGTTAVMAFFTTLFFMLGLKAELTHILLLVVFVSYEVGVVTACTVVRLLQQMESEEI